MFKRLFLTTTAALNAKLHDVPLKRIRNIGIIAHIDAGKTTTTERMLFYSGKTARIGNVDEGDTVTDYLPLERERGITIQSAAITIAWNNTKINVIDTPGHADFTFEVIRLLRVLDGAVTILDAVAGVEAQTEKVWKQAQELGIPKLAYVNKMDRPGAGFSRTVKEMIHKLQTRVVLVTLPYFRDEQFVGVIDVLHQKVLVWDPTDPSGRKVTAHGLNEPGFETAAAECALSRELMVETLSELDENVIDSFFEADEDHLKVPVAVLELAIRTATIANEITPVLCGSSFRNIGVQPLMDSVTLFLPSPLEAPVPEVASRTILGKKKKKQAAASTVDVPVKMTANGVVVNNQPLLAMALAFKVMTHATKGVMTFFRVYSGKLVHNLVVVNTRTGAKLHLKKLMVMHGDEPTEVKQIGAGNIGVVLGHEDDIITGDTLVAIANKKSFSDHESHLKLNPIDIPPPLFNLAIEPRTAGDERYMNECLRVLVREDPSLTVLVDEELGQTVVLGMGELHLEIIRERLVKDMGAKVRLQDVVVSYRETLTKALPELTFTDPLGASVTVALDLFEGNAAECDAAQEEGAMVFEADNNVVILDPATSTAPHVTETLDQRRWKAECTMEDLQDAVVQGCMTALQLGGPAYGMALHSMVVRVISWDFPVDESGVLPLVLAAAARTAISEFTRSSLAFCILEPVMDTRVYVGAEHLGEVSHDLTQRCQAVIKSIDEDDGANVDSANWASREAETVYLPPDYTMGQAKAASVASRKIILAQTPLKEMVGYLSKLRSMTGGRGTFDMTYVGMRRANAQRSDQIARSL